MNISPIQDKILSLPDHYRTESLSIFELNIWDMLSSSYKIEDGLDKLKKVI